MSIEILLDRRNVDIFHKSIKLKPLMLTTKHYKTKLDGIKKRILKNVIYDSICQHKQGHKPVVLLKYTIPNG